MAAGAGYLFLATPVYTSEAKIRYPQLSPRMAGNGVNAAGANQSFLNTEAEVIGSSAVLLVALGEPGMEQIELFQVERNPIRALKSGLHVRIGQKNDLITVAYDSPNRFDAQTVVTSVVNAYRTFQAKERQDAVDAIDSERQKIVEELVARHHELIAFKKEHHQLSFDDDRSNPILQRLAGLSDALTEAHLDAVNARSAWEDAAGAIAGDSELQRRLGGLTSDDSRLSVVNEQMLRSELFNLQQRLEEAKRQYGANHPLVGSIQGRIDHLTVAFVGVARDRWQAAERRQAELERAYAQVQEQVAEYQAIRTQHDQLVREVERLQRLADDLAARTRSMSIADGTGTMNITVLENATLPDTPSAPRQPRVLVIALAGGLFVGLGLAMLADWRDQRLRHGADVKAALGVPLLGVVPVMPAMAPSARGVQADLNPAGETAEAIRSIRTNLYFALPDTARTILVTSPLTGDGKSTLISNLAISMAQAGRRILIVDANGRLPVQHKIFSLAAGKGLAGVLGGGAVLDEVIVHTGVDSLDLLPCGVVTVDPAELLNSQDFSDLLGDLATRYDHILIDSPALTVAADARIAAAWCDGTLLVLHAHQADRRLAQTARDGLIAVGANLLGVVVNGVDPQSRKHSFHAELSYAAASQPQLPAMTQTPYLPTPSAQPQQNEHTEPEVDPLPQPADAVNHPPTELHHEIADEPDLTIEPLRQSEPVIDPEIAPDPVVSHEDDDEPTWLETAHQDGAEQPAKEADFEEPADEPQPPATSAESTNDAAPSPDDPQPEPAADASQPERYDRPQPKPKLEQPHRESRNIVTGLTPEKLAETSAELRRKFEALR